VEKSSAVKEKRKSKERLTGEDYEACVEIYQLYRFVGIISWLLCFDEIFLSM